MIYLRTRSFARDYEYFSKEQPDFSWRKKYDDVNLYSETENNIFVEANGNSFDALLGRFIGEREDKFYRIIGYEIYVAGKTNSGEAKFVLALILYLLQDANVKERFSEIGKKLDTYFTKDFADSLDNCRNTPKTQNLVLQKLQAFYDDVLKNVLDSAAPNNVKLPQRKFSFFGKRVENMRSLANCAGKVLLSSEGENISGKSVLVYTDVILEQKFCDELVQNYFAAENIFGMVITSNTNTDYISLPYEISLAGKTKSTDKNEGVEKMKNVVIAILAALLVAGGVHGYIAGKSSKATKNAIEEAVKVENEKKELEQKFEQVKISVSTVISRQKEIDSKINAVADSKAEEISENIEGLKKLNNEQKAELLTLEKQLGITEYAAESKNADTKQ